jgi:hypothetical protein
VNLNRIATALLFTVVIATPAFANWFDNFMVGENHKKLLGSATTPTPDDLRAIGDSGRGTGKSYQFDPKSGHWHEVRPSTGNKQAVQGPSEPAPASADGRAGAAAETTK